MRSLKWSLKANKWLVKIEAWFSKSRIRFKFYPKMHTIGSGWLLMLLLLAWLRLSYFFFNSGDTIFHKISVWFSAGFRLSGFLTRFITYFSQWFICAHWNHVSCHSYTTKRQWESYTQISFIFFLTTSQKMYLGFSIKLHWKKDHPFCYPWSHAHIGFPLRYFQSHKVGYAWATFSSTLVTQYSTKSQFGSQPVFVCRVFWRGS